MEQNKEARTARTGVFLKVGVMEFKQSEFLCGNLCILFYLCLDASPPTEKHAGRYRSF